MCRDTLDLIGTMKLDDLKTQFALQCAPVVIGLKVSNLLIVRSDQVQELYELLKDSRLSFYALCVGRERAVLLIYEGMRLNCYLRLRRVREMMQTFGYGEPVADRILPILRKKYQSYDKGTGEFPHELGLVLGYPVEDVEGFMKNRGENSLYTGYWKVYQNLPAKLKLFEAFEAAQQKLVGMVAAGVEMKEIIGG